EEEFYQQLSELPFPPPLEMGQSMDGYKIIRELHATKRTQVYLALDIEANQQVVIKTPSVNFQDDAEYIDGFLHEEWAGRRINSPHVLKVLEPQRRRRFLYYVTEYIQGQTLEQWITDNPQPDINTVRHIVEQIVAGVRAFHRQEMIHQDLKPGNILIDQQGTAKIIDFGSTKIAGIQEIAASITRGQLLGTYDYAAPEYLEGYPGTPCSDLFSLGVITYLRTLKKARYISAKQLNPTLPAWIDGALEKAVSIHPTHRYEAMSEFLTDLSKPNPKLIKQRQPLIDRHPVAVWRGVALFLLAMNLILLYLLYRR
ncbi:MAG: protein phosphatase 2C-like protein, partial [Halothiobacillaceae bacterium]